MKIEFEREGGYAPMEIRYHTDSDKLIEKTAQKLETQVRTSGFWDINQGTLLPKGQAPDVFSYKITISDKGRSKSLSFDDISAPASLRPLLELLQELALADRVP